MKRQVINHWSDNFNPREVQLIRSALFFPLDTEALEHEAGDREQIADILNHINVDSDTIVSATLLVGLEAKDFSQPMMEERYSDSICRLVTQSQALIRLENDWLKKLQGGLGGGDSDAHHMMLLNMMKDARSVFIILAFQVLKMQGLERQNPEERRRVAQETERVFAPLANRLGIGQLKWELEDLAFRYLQPTEYKNIAKALEERRVDREAYIASFVAELQHKLDEAGLDAEVVGRAKHIYSIWKKMQKKELAFSDLYDVRAVRVMVNDLSSCYTALSIVHNLWQFIPSEYDDYVAAPKANNYQSLHTAVRGREDKVVEVQIRTGEMHAHAELGVAAHWRYKEGGKRDEGLENQLEFLRDVLSRPEGGDAALQQSSTIYVFSPKGHVVKLPLGSTPLDFAYHIHSDVGNKCRGAKVNGKMVPLTTPLLNGETVEVITTKDAQPSRDWLVSHFGYLKSSRAKSKVRAWFKREFRNEHIQTGKTALHRHVSILPSATALKNLAEAFNMRHVDDLYAAIGRGDLGVHQVLNSLKVPEEKTEEKDYVFSGKPIKSHKGDIVIEGVDDLMTKLARCCKPLPGDSIAGFITQGRGVSIHREDCKNLFAIKIEYPQRMLEASWANKQGGRYEVDVEILAMDRSGLLRDVMAVFSGCSMSVNTANTFIDKKNQQARIRLTVDIVDQKELTQVLAKLINVKGILEASRST